MYTEYPVTLNRRNPKKKVKKKAELSILELDIYYKIILLFYAFFYFISKKSIMCNPKSLFWQ